MNPFQMMEQFQEFQERAENLLRDITPDWVLKAAAANVIKWVLTIAKKEGPPEGFAEKLKMTPQQAKTLYDLTLDAALSRNVTPAAKAIPSGVTPSGETHNGE